MIEGKFIIKHLFKKVETKRFVAKAYRDLKYDRMRVGKDCVTLIDTKFETAYAEINSCGEIRIVSRPGIPFSVNSRKLNDTRRISYDVGKLSTEENPSTDEVICRNPKIRAGAWVTPDK